MLAFRLTCNECLIFHVKIKLTSKLHLELDGIGKDRYMKAWKVVDCLPQVRQVKVDFSCP